MRAGHGAILSVAYVQRRVMSRVDERIVTQVSFGQSRLLENDMIYLKMTYRLRMPVSVLESTVSPWRPSARAERGLARREGALPAELGEADASDPFVYVKIRPYHVDPHCTICTTIFTRWISHRSRA